MNTQLALAFGIVDMRAHADQDQVLMRNVELARQDARRSRRLLRQRTR